MGPPPVRRAAGGVLPAVRDPNGVDGCPARRKPRTFVHPTRGGAVRKKRRRPRERPEPILCSEADRAKLLANCLRGGEMSVEHRVTVALKANSDEEAEQIERQVGALGYEILDCRRDQGAEPQESPRRPDDGSGAPEDSSEDGRRRSDQVRLPAMRRPPPPGRPALSGEAGRPHFRHLASPTSSSTASQTFSDSPRRA
jgi:hypothetical protein